MKKLIVLLMVCSILFIDCASCKVIQNREVCPYGILSKDEKQEDVVYKKKRSSIILSIIGIETIILPIILLGFKLYEADSLKGE